MHASQCDNSIAIKVTSRLESQTRFWCKVWNMKKGGQVRDRSATLFSCSVPCAGDMFSKHRHKLAQKQLLLASQSSALHFIAIHFYWNLPCIVKYGARYFDVLSRH